MAIGMHIAKLSLYDHDSSASTAQVRRIAPDNDIPNSAGHPTLDAYLKLEAANNYLPISYPTSNDNSVVTVNVSDMNGA